MPHPTAEAPAPVQLGVTFDGGADAKSMLSAFEGRHVLAMPLLGEGEREYLDSLTTVAAVIAASEEPKSVIDVTLSGS